MASFAGSSKAAQSSWGKKKKNSLIDAALSAAQAYALPVLLAGFLARRYILGRKAKAGAKPGDKATADAGASATPAAVAAERAARRHYKVKRDALDVPLLAGGDDEEGVEVQPGDHVVEQYDEADVEAAGAAAGGPGGGNTAMLKMLQQMGYRIVMPKDGSGQVFLVPPGAAGPGGEAIDEGDEEGYDEDEEGEEDA